MSVKVGEPAPELDLPGTDGTSHGTREYKLTDYRGRPVLLVFYPGDNTPVCTRQLNAYTREIDDFREVDVEILAISPQSVASHESFQDAQGGFAFPLLADEDKEVGKRYGVLGPVGFYRRSVFLVDSEGVIRYLHRAVAGLSYRPTSELVEAVRALHSG